MFDKFKFWKRPEEINPSAEEFHKVSLEEDDAGVSVTEEQYDADSGYGMSPMLDSSQSVGEYLAAPVSTNKVRRLNEYRVMANHVEVSDAIDEIADSIYNKDESGKFAKLDYPDDSKVSDKQREILDKEFQRFLQLFNFEENSYNYGRTFVIEGELAFENIINPNEPKKGILSVKLLQNERYELLKDLRNGEIIGIFFDVKKADINTILHADFGNNLFFFREVDANSQSSTYRTMWGNEKKIPLLWSQLTYIHTGLFDNNRTFVYPPLDRSRQAYRQLVLVEDGVIIYRIARSPERLVFNIASGNQSGQKAQQMLAQMVKRFNMRKATKQGSGGERQVANVYDSHQVVESFWFLKPSDTEGSNVESIGGQAQFGELEDLKFFTRKLYRSMKVPFSRFEQPENTISKGEDITYEEYKFAKFVTRIQLAFASGLYGGFKTHLKLRGLWKQYNLTNHDFSVKITPPALYELYQTARLNELKMEAYDKIADNENFSYTIAMKKILNMSDDEIKENMEKLKEEKFWNAEIEYWVEKITEHGSEAEAKKAIAREKADGADEEDMGGNGQETKDQQEKPEDQKPEQKPEEKKPEENK